MAGLPPRAASPPSGDGRPLMLFTPNDGSSYVIVSTEQPRAKEMLVIGERAAATPCYSRATAVLQPCYRVSCYRVDSRAIQGQPCSLTLPRSTMAWLTHPTSRRMRRPEERRRASRAHERV